MFIREPDTSNIDFRKSFKKFQNANKRIYKFSDMKINYNKEEHPKNTTYSNYFSTPIKIKNSNDAGKNNLLIKKFKVKEKDVPEKKLYMDRNITLRCKETNLETINYAKFFKIMKKDTPNVKVDTNCFIKSLKEKNYDIFNRPIKSFEKKFIPPYALTETCMIETNPSIHPLSARTLTPKHSQMTQCLISSHLNRYDGTPRNLISKNCITLNFSPICNLKSNSSVKRNVLLKFNNNSLQKTQSRNPLKIYDINKQIDLTNTNSLTKSHGNLNDPQFDFYAKKFVIRKINMNEGNNKNANSFSVIGHRVDI